MKSLSKWWFDLKFSNDLIVKDYVEQLWNDTILYLTDDSKSEISILRNGTDVWFKDRMDVFKYKGCLLTGDNEYVAYLSGGQRKFINPIVSDKKVVRDVYLENVSAILNHNFSEPVISSKTIFEEFVKNTIEKYSWCFNSYDGIGTQVGSTNEFNVYENYGTYTIQTKDKIKVIRITDDNYAKLLNWYITQIVTRTKPEVPYWLLNVKKLLDGQH